MNKMKLIVLFLSLLSLFACSNPTQVIIIEIFTIIEEIDNSDKYMISPVGGIIPVTPKWKQGLPILRGKIVNVSEDTLFNKMMEFIITEIGAYNNVVSRTYGYMTLDITEFAYYTEYPYKIEPDLAPGEAYNIYVIGDTLDLNRSYNWFFKLKKGDE